MAELRLMIGLPASGKTTHAKLMVERHNYVNSPERWARINWDEMRIELGMHLRKFNRKDEDEMQKLSFLRAEALLQAGHSVIIDNTNLNPNTRAKWAGVAQRVGAQYTEFPFNTTLEECIKRDNERQGIAKCGRAVIERMALFAGLIHFPANERYIIVDMDGTLSNHTDVRGPYDESRVSEDKPFLPIIELVQLLNAGVGDGGDGYRVLIVTGRHIDAGMDTVAWLEKHNVPFDHIFMRQSADNRKDFIIKQEILDRLPKNQIKYVFDDRNQVVDMWRANGLTCLQVAPGDF